MNRNTLKAFINPTFLTMFFLGISCGFPLALTASVLKTWLASNGLSIKSIAAFAFVAVPYSIKFIWSPFLDAIKIPYLGNALGQRRSWLLIIQILLMIAIFLLGYSNPKEDLLYCMAAATLVAFLSASQDIVVDAYRIEKLPTELQALGVAMYVYGYRIGLYGSGVGLLILADSYSWQVAYTLGAVFIAIGVVTTLLSDRPTYKYKDIHKKSYIDKFLSVVIDPFKEFVSINKWYYVIAFVVLFKLGDAIAGNLTTTFLIKKGFTLGELALYVKTYGLIATMIGLFIGGIILQRFNLFKTLIFAATLQMLSNLMFIYQDYMGHDTNALMLTIFIENISGAIGDVVFIAYLSSMCSFQFAATQYALFSSIATIARTTISGFSGVIVDNYSWSIFFIVSIIAAIPGILMIFKIRDIKRVQK